MSVTGTWEEATLDVAGVVVGFTWEVLEKNAPLIFAVASVGALVGLSYLVKIAVAEAWKALRYLWWRTKAKYLYLYHRVRKHPTFRRTKEFLMAKGERQILADILHDALFEANMRGTITDKQYNRFSKIVGKGMDLPDLLTKKLHRAYFRAYFKGDAEHAPTYKKLAGPKGKIPGGPPKPIKAGDPVGPPPPVSNIAFLNRKGVKAA